MPTSTLLIQVLARVVATFTGVMLAGLISVAYFELIYIPGNTPLGITSTAGLWQLAVATVVGGVAALALAVEAHQRTAEPARSSAPPVQAASLTD